MPLLGDQSYGQFVFFGEKGGAFGYLSAIEEPACEDIDKRLKRAGLFTTSRNRSEIERFQRVIAALADSIGGQSLIPSPVCPSCRSSSIAHGDATPLEIREIPSVTFHDYQALSDKTKTERLCELWRQFTQ